MIFPLRTEELTGFLPHRNPMVWVDRIMHVSAQQGSTEVTLNHRLMLDRGRVHVGALVEFLAQSYGFIMAVEAMQRHRQLKVAQLAAIDRFELYFLGHSTLPILEFSQCVGSTILFDSTRVPFRKNV